MIDGKSISKLTTQEATNLKIMQNIVNIGKILTKAIATFE